MSAQMRRIEIQASGLSPEERERLAQRLLRGLRDETLTDVDEAWIREAERRHKAWKKDRSRVTSGASMIRELRKSLAR